MVDLVGEDAQGERLVDSLVEAGEQLEQALTTAAHQHGVIAVFIGGGGDATDRAQHANGDVAGRLHRSAAEQKLDLFEFSSIFMAEAGATATKIVGCQIVYAARLAYRLTI